MDPFLIAFKDGKQLELNADVESGNLHMAIYDKPDYISVASLSEQQQKAVLHWLRKYING